MQSQSRPELYIHEWIAVTIITGVFALLAINAYLSSPPLSFQLGEPHHLQDPFVDVFISGSVVHPGPFRVPRGATLEVALKSVEFLPEADIGALNLQSKVRPNQAIKVRAKKPLKQLKKGRKGVGEKPLGETQQA